ncbi:MAG: response regulator [Christensenellaceae bacterium]|nr:response regulator [Christensenellaceae bacterium]
MTKSINVYDLLISCPSDVSKFVNLLEKQVNHFNNYFGRANGVIVRCRYWTKDTYSEFGNSPQDLINRQIVDSSDMVVAVFWSRFGTATENYGSGTEEEIERMLSLKKQVFLYFLDKPIPPSKLDHAQYDKIIKFKEKHSNNGVFFTISNEKTLATKFRENMELYFDSIIRGSELKKSGGQKSVLWVDDRPENNVYVRKILEQYGIDFTLALSTRQALNCLKNGSFSLIISDMGRKEGKSEGYVLLEEVRKFDKQIPYIIYAGSRREEHINETLRRGGQGCTNIPSELIDLVIRNLLNS